MFFHLPLSRKKMKGRRLLGSYSLNFPLPVSVCPMIEDESKKKKIKMFRVIIASVLGMLEPAKGPAMGKFP